MATRSGFGHLTTEAGLDVSVYVCPHAGPIKTAYCSSCRPVDAKMAGNSIAVKIRQEPVSCDGVARHIVVGPDGPL